VRQESLTKAEDVSNPPQRLEIVAFRYGTGERIVPLFPELRTELDALFAIAEPGVSCPADSYVITRYRSTESNLRTTFLKIVDRAGVPRFPKPFNNLRASRRTELERTGRFPNHVLNDWFGHSGEVAETYYLQTTEDDYAEAIQATADLVGQSVGQSDGEQDASTRITNDEKPKKKPLSIPVDGVESGFEYSGGNSLREDSRWVR
jgi:integrase